MNYRVALKITHSLSEIKINERSLVKLYERTKTATTAPIYTASFFPGSRFPDVLKEMTSDFGIIKSSCDMSEWKWTVHLMCTMNKLFLPSSYLDFYSNQRIKKSIRLSNPGGIVEWRLFSKKFESNIWMRIAFKSFFKISIPLNVIIFWETSSKTRTCQLKYQCWNRFASSLKCPRSKITRQFGSLVILYPSNNRNHGNW